MALPKRFLAAVTAAIAFTGTALSAPFTVEANKTEPLRFKRPAVSIIIGNPLVADVAIFNDQMVFVTGKSYGTTNLMAFDASGKLIYSNDITVLSPTTNLLRIVRGESIQSYDCTPECRSIMNPGDDQAYFDNVYQQNQQIARAAEQ